MAIQFSSFAMKDTVNTKFVTDYILQNNAAGLTQQELKVEAGELLKSGKADEVKLGRLFATLAEGGTEANPLFRSADFDGDGRIEAWEIRAMADANKRDALLTGQDLLGSLGQAYSQTPMQLSLNITPPAADTPAPAPAYQAPPAADTPAPAPAADTPAPGTAPTQTEATVSFFQSMTNFLQNPNQTTVVNLLTSFMGLFSALQPAGATPDPAPAPGTPAPAVPAPAAPQV